MRSDLWSVDVSSILCLLLCALLISLCICRPPFNHHCTEAPDCNKLMPFEFKLSRACSWSIFKESSNSASCSCPFRLYLCRWHGTGTWSLIQAKAWTTLGWWRGSWLFFSQQCCGKKPLNHLVGHCRIKHIAQKTEEHRNKLNLTTKITLKHLGRQLAQPCSHLCVAGITLRKYLSWLLYKEQRFI